MEMSRKQRRAPLWPAAILVVAASSTTRQSSLHCFTTRAFQPSPAFIIQPQGGGRRKHPVPPQKRRACSLWSSVGDDDDGPPRKPPPPGGGGDGGGRRSNGGWDDFLNADPNESDNLRRAREYMSENSLPISFGRSEEGGAEGTARGEEEAATDQEEAVSASEQGATSSSSLSSSSSSSALVGPETTPDDTGSGLMQAPSPEMLANNPYMAVVSKLSPSELISKFTSNAHPRVQNAVRSTILGLIGGLPKLAFDTTTITTGQRLASLMFQLQMTGYMFKNAEYRLSLQQSLGQLSDGGLLLEGGSLEDDPLDADRTDPLAGKIRGKLRIHLGGPKLEEENDDDNATTTTAVGADGGVEVDAAAYLSELRSEVSQLREDLMITRKEKEDALRKDLLAYIRTLPERELRSLTNTMSQDVLVAMKGLVNAVLTGIGEGKIGAETVTEQSGEAMAQLCMWQLVIGYNLRTLEVREEMKKSLLSGVTWDPSKEDPPGGIDTSDPGSLQ